MPLVVALAALCWSAEAAAGVTITQTIIGRPTASDLAPNRTTQAQQYVSFDDCKTNKYNAQFTVSATSGSVYVWASEGNIPCDQLISRQSGGGCNAMFAGAAQPTGQPIVLTAKDLVKALATPVDTNTCIDTTGQTTGHQLTVYFIDSGATGGDVASGSFATWATTVDLLGPNVPSGVDLTAGDKLLILNIPATMDTDRQGFYVYCSPAINGAGGPYTPDGGLLTTVSSSSTSSSSSSSSSSTSSSSSSGGAGGADGGADGGLGGAGGSSGVGGAGGSLGAGGTGGSTAAAACSDTIPGLTPGVAPPVDAPICATLNLDATTATIANAANGQKYVIAVAAYDAVNNIGPLTTSLCQTPEPTDTFFGEYCRDGGAACPGCGQCTVGPSSVLTWPALGTAALAAVALGMRRSKRRAPRGRKRMERE